MLFWNQASVGLAKIGAGASECQSIRIKSQELAFLLLKPDSASIPPFMKYPSRQIVPKLYNTFNRTRTLSIWFYLPSFGRRQGEVHERRKAIARAEMSKADGQWRPVTTSDDQWRPVHSCIAALPTLLQDAARWRDKSPSCRVSLSRAMTITWILRHLEDKLSKLLQLDAGSFLQDKRHKGIRWNQHLKEVYVQNA